MKNRTGSRLAWGLFLLFVLLVSSAVALHLLSSDDGRLTGAAFVIPFSIFPTVGAVVASRRPENSIGWLFIALGLGPALGLFGIGYARHALIENPGTLPFGNLAVWLGVWTWAALLLIIFLLLLFPTGRLPSRRWLPIAWIDGAVLLVSLVSAALSDEPPDPELLPGIENPLGVSGMAAVSDWTFYVAGPLVLVSAISLVFRYRRSSGDERQQIKWFAYAALIAGVCLPISDFVPYPISDILAFIAFTSLGVGAGIAILRYRLYDIDVVINKTLVYGLLAAFITVVYLGIVVVIAAVGAGRRGSLPLSIVATALIAVAFQPVRQRVQRFANRLVYGKRATPYEVLSEFSQRVIRYSAAEVVPQIAELIRDASSVVAVEVWLRVGQQLELRGIAPPDSEVPDRRIDLAGEDQPEIPGVTATVPIVYQDELLGLIGVRTHRGRDLDPPTRSLLQDFARQSALVLRNVRLFAELQASRQRLVSAQNEERRKLERDLHDGAQQQLVALKVQLGLVERISAEEKVKTMLGQLQASTDETINTLRDLARGIYPPVLADQGLAAALNAQASKSHQQISISPDGIGRYPQAVEAAVYFCCLEAMQNASKYAGQSQVEVRLFQANGGLVFEVRDEGPGFDPARVKRGSGLQNMTDRVEALGGSLEIEARPGQGSTIRGRVPVK